MTAERDHARGISWGTLESDVSELYERAPCALVSTLPDGTIIRANQTFCAWLGVAPEAIVGRVRFQDLLAVGSRIYYDTHYAPLLQMQGWVREVALDIRAAGGAVRPIIASTEHVLGSDGEVRAHRVALLDSTDRRRYEQQLLEARKSAEAATRTVARISEEKSDFIALLAHELRNPLAPIVNAVAIMERASGAVSEQAVSVLRRQVGQMVRLVEDLIDISRIGRDKLSLRREPLDLASVVHQAREASAPLLHATGLQYTAALPLEPVYVEGDAARLVQVIGNILNNAAKFTPRGGSVTLILERDGSDAIVRIRDTGIGVEPARLTSIFEMFVQADAPSESRTGLGVGLTLARTLTEQHGGSLTASSDGLGRGTEFVVRLPALAIRPDTVVHSGPPAVGTAAASRRVLVVDDDDDSVEMMAALLTMSGHHVRTAHDGPAAVDAAAEFAPEIVLLDIGLPGMSGYEVAQRIGQLPGIRPVLAALTGWGQDEDRTKAAEAGFHHHLVKPVDHDALLALVGAARIFAVD